MQIAAIANGTAEIKNFIVIEPATWTTKEKHASR